VDGGTSLELFMEARAYKPLARFMNLLIKRFLIKALASDMDAAMEFCEQ
jgi:hypothetical protein